VLLLLLALQCPDGSPPPCAGVRAPAPISVAILPFESRSSDSMDLYLAEALPEQITARLARISRLRVRSAASVSAQWRRTPDPSAAARAMRVDWYVTGSVRRAGRQLSVSAELVRAATGDGVWGAPFRRTDNDLAAIEEQLAESIAVVVVDRLAPAQLAAVRTSRPRDVESYRLHLVAGTLLNRRTSADIGRAVTLLNQAVSREPRFAAAWARLAYARVMQIQWGSAELLSRDSLAALGRSAADRALRLDSSQADAWLAIASVNLASARLGIDLWAAHQALQRSIRSDSLNVEAWHMLSYLFGAVRLQLPWLSERYARRAIELNPDFRNAWRMLAYALLAQGRAEDAEASLDSALARGEWAVAHHLRADARFVRGNIAGALADLDATEAAADMPAGMAAEIPLTRRLMRSAVDSSEARSLAEWLRAERGQGQPRHVVEANLAMVLGRTSEAVAILEQLKATPDPAPQSCGPVRCSSDLRIWLALHSPFFVRSHGEPAIAALLEETRPRVPWAN